MFGGAVQKASKRRMKLGFFQKKRVMTLVGFDFNETDIGRDRIKGVHQAPRFRRREQPIGPRERRLSAM